MRQDTGWPVNWPWEPLGGVFASAQTAGGKTILALLLGYLKVYI